MNRKQAVQALAACEALARALRATLNADLRAEYAEQGTVPTYRMPGYTVSASLTHDATVVVDEKAFIDYVAAAYPTEVQTVTSRQVRPAFLGPFLEGLASRGDPPCEADGTVVPGVEFKPGGEFRTVTVNVAAETKESLRSVATEIATGQRPLGLPQTVEAMP